MVAGGEWFYGVISPGKAEDLLGLADAVPLCDQLECEEMVVPVWVGEACADRVRI